MRCHAQNAMSCSICDVMLNMRCHTQYVMSCDVIKLKLYTYDIRWLVQHTHFLDSAIKYNPHLLVVYFSENHKSKKFWPILGLNIIGCTLSIDVGLIPLCSAFFLLFLMQYWKEWFDEIYFCHYFHQRSSPPRLRPPHARCWVSTTRGDPFLGVRGSPLIFFSNARSP